MEWIDVKERLPEEMQEVLTIIVGGLIPNPIVQAFWEPRSRQWKTIDTWPCAKPMFPPTHWMPLPPPPEKKE